MDAFLDLLKFAVGMGTIMTLWIGVQALVRRVAHKPAGEDMLDHLAHGCCGGCEKRGQCQNKDERNH